MTRREQIEKAVFDIYNGEEDVVDMGLAKFGRLCAEWADENPKDQWTLVKDGLPEEDEDNEGYSVKVIGLFEDDEKKQYISDCFCSIEEGIWFVDIYTSSQPIAWIPIPKFNK